MSEQNLSFKGQEYLYSQFSRSHFSWDYIEKPALDKYLTELLPQNPTILDAGCGSGRLVGHLLSSGVKPKKITGVDENEIFINMARQNYPEVEFVHSGLETAVFKNMSFDVIVSTMVLQHLSLSRFDMTMENFYRWLKPGGDLLYLVPHPFSFKDRPMADYFNRSPMMVDTPWGEKVQVYPRTFDDYMIKTMRTGFFLESVDEPELPERAKSDPDWFNYSQRPTRLIVLAKK